MATGTMKKGDTRHTLGRRELLAGGLTVGVGSLIHGSMPALASEGVDGIGSMGQSGGEQAPTEIPMTIPGEVAGARMIGVFGTAFSTWVYSSTEQSSVVYASGKGARVSGAGLRLAAPVLLRPGSRVVSLHYYGYRDTEGVQTFWFSRRDPTTFGVTDLYSNSMSGTGVLSFGRTTNELILGGYDYCIVGTTSSTEPYVRGAIVQYIPPTGDFQPIPPKRVYDSRVSGGAILKDQERTVPVRYALGTTSTVVPTASKAVALNMTITQTVNSGWLSIRPYGTAWDGTSNINWTTSGTTVANGVTSLLGGDRQVIIRCGGAGGARTHFVLDVVGYYI